MSASTITLIASALQNASGNGAWIPVQTLTMLQVEVDITVGVAVTAFDLWLQGSSKGGADAGYDLIADRTILTADAAAAGAKQSDERDIVPAKTTITAERFWGLYKHLPAKFVRVKWTLTGTSITFEVLGSGK